MTKNKLILMLLSLVSAFLLWLYVITFISPESEETITGIAVIDPAETERVLDARGLMLLQEEPITVTLTLEGNRTDLVKLNNSNLKIKVDYSNINNEGDQMEPNVEIFWPEGTVTSKSASFTAPALTTVRATSLLPSLKSFLPRKRSWNHGSTSKAPRPAVSLACDI